MVSCPYIENNENVSYMWTVRIKIWTVSYRPAPVQSKAELLHLGMEAEVYEVYIPCTLLLDISLHIWQRNKTSKQSFSPETKHRHCPSQELARSLGSLQENAATLSTNLLKPYSLPESAIALNTGRSPQAYASLTCN